jgi:ABC-type sugar transport system ATPase subunit
MTARKKSPTVSLQRNGRGATDARDREVSVSSIWNIWGQVPGADVGGAAQRVASQGLSLLAVDASFDEPLSPWTRSPAELRQRCRSLQKELCITTVMVTHDQKRR